MSDIHQVLEELYPQKGDELVNEVRQAKKSVPTNQDIANDWYRHTHMYVTYPDSFIVDGKSDFYTLANQLERISALGCDSLHILPFLASPMVDGGFDVSDFYAVRQDLGGMEAFEYFHTQAKKHHIHLYMDLALNHVSNQHHWFNQATAGDARFQDYFIHQTKQPTLVNRSDGVATYAIDDTEVSIPIIFPDQGGELPHWIQHNDGNWYFHTFYPHQIDLNWNNPNVCKEFIHIIAFWSKYDFNFRIDAAPHLDKKFEGFQSKNTKRNLQLIKALHLIIKELQQSSVMLVEVVDSIDNIETYFTESQADSAYNFTILNALWSAMVLADTTTLWQVLERSFPTAQHSQWQLFLRSHDALMLGFIPGENPNKLHQQLVDKGRAFGEGIEVAGRLASFLDRDPNKILLIHFLMASIPGALSIFYGDELGKENDEAYMKTAVINKRNNCNDQSIAEDPRELGRGLIDENLLHHNNALYIQNQLAEILKLRRKYPIISTTKPTRIDHGTHGLFACSYQTELLDISVYINLTANVVIVDIPHPQTPLIKVNGAYISNKKIFLPAFSGLWTS